MQTDRDQLAANCVFCRIIARTRAGRRGNARRFAQLELRAACGNLFFAAPAGELDEVLVELEPNPVIAVDPW
jgi:hypothetical protein